MKCIDLLKKDHTIILRALDVLDHMAARTEKNEFVEPEDTKAILRFLRRFADNDHQTKEECVLFPELMRSAVNDGPLRQMIFEHNQERSLVEGLEEALCTKKGTDFIYFAQRLTALVRAHIHKEDNILFRIAEKSPLAAEDERMTRGLEQFQTDRSLIDDLLRLEWVYLGRGAKSAGA